jgi:hypothetical protein
MFKFTGDRFIRHYLDSSTHYCSGYPSQGTANATMTDLKLLPPVGPMLALPNRSFQTSGRFVEEEILDALLKELTEFVSKRAAELGEQKQVEMEDCKRLVSQSAALNSHHEHVWADIIEGSSLAFNPFPVRKPHTFLTDEEALHRDWIDAFSDANKVWNTIEACIPKSSKPR